MNSESILPRMSIANQDAILGSVLSLVHLNYIIALVGEAGLGKTVTVLDFCSRCPVPTFYYRCSNNLTMKSLLAYIAGCIGIETTRNDSSEGLQRIIEAQLYDNPNYYFVFDEAEYLCNGNTSKLDVIRQIWDATGIRVILVGTNELMHRITGIKRRNPYLTNHQSQIARRIRKEEFQAPEQMEINDYLLNLELNYAVRFTSEVKNKLISICRDKRNGGLSSMILCLQMTLEIYRPEWVDISNNLNYQNKRIPHDFYSIQSFNSKTKTDQPIKPLKQIDINNLNIIEIGAKELNEAIKRNTQTLQIH